MQETLKESSYAAKTQGKLIMGKEYEEALKDAAEALVTPQIYTPEEIETFKMVLQMQ